MRRSYTIAYMKRRKKKPLDELLGKLVWVSWIDSCSADGWLSESALKNWCNDEPYPCETVGWLVGIAKDCINLACTRTGTGKSHAGLWKIPKRCVKEVIEIKDL